MSDFTYAYFAYVSFYITLMQRFTGSTEHSLLTCVVGTKIYELALITLYDNFFH